MEDPYANYKHRSSEILSDIYYKKGDYQTALSYFALSDTAYPYLHFCGNEYASNDIHTALRYADIYQQLKLPEKAIEKLLPAVLITLADNAEVIKALKKLLVGRKGLKQELDDSLSKLYTKGNAQEGNSYEWHYFKFLNVEIAAPEHYEDVENKFDKERTIMAIKQSDFYKMIENL